MGRRGTARPSEPTSMVSSVLSVVLGVVLLVVGVAIALTFVAMLVFGGLDLFEEVGHTGDGTGAVVLGLAVVGGMIAAGGLSLVRPALDRQHERYRRFDAASFSRERAVVVWSAVALVLASCASFVLRWPPTVSVVVGLAQFTVVVYSLVRVRAVMRGHRWPYVVVAVGSFVLNPLTLIALVVLGYAVTGRPLT